MGGLNTDLTGRVAVVTGSSKGLGAETVTLLATMGAIPVVTYNSDADSATAVAAAIGEAGGTAHVHRLDMGSVDSIQEFFEWLRGDDGPGGIDIFVANAAATAFKDLIDQKPHNVDRTFAISVTGFLEATRHCVPIMQARGGGRLVVVSGGDTRTFGPTHGLLAAAKAAMEVMVQYLQVELAGTGVTSIGVNPGVFHSDGPRLMFGELYDTIMGLVGATSPVGRVPEPAEAAQVIALACTDAAALMTGSTIVADGGDVFAKPGKLVETAFRLQRETVTELIEQMGPTPWPTPEVND